MNKLFKLKNRFALIFNYTIREKKNITDDNDEISLKSDYVTHIYLTL